MDTNKAIPRFILAAIATALIKVGVDYGADPVGTHRAWGAGLIAGAILVAVLAVWWNRITYRIKSRWKPIASISAAVLVGVLGQRSPGPWVPDAAVLAAATLVLILAAAGIASVVRLRRDLDRYAMPRVVTASQADAIARHVVGEGTVVIKVDSRDREATAYAHQLLGAFTNTKWLARLDTTDTPPNVGEGLTIQMTGHSNAPDKRNPGRESQLLASALEKSGVLINGSGAQGAGDYGVFICVGKRPIDYRRQPLRARLGTWIIRHLIMRPR